MPRLDFWFRLFLHASLALASVCLLYAEAFFLEEPLLIGLYLTAGLQVVAFGADGRRLVLPAWAANVLAVAVALAGVAWIAAELSAPDSVLASLPLPAGLLPYIGPILIGLLVIKLFRPRTARDFWLLQGVGALQVGLACVLATNPDSGLLFALFFTAYLACSLGCLALHYFQEQQSRGNASGPAGRLPFAYLLTPFCLRWTLAVAAVAAPLFLATPRLGGPAWDSSVSVGGGTQPETRGGLVGYTQTIDLNRDGPVRLSDDEVFRVKVVVPPEQTAPALPGDQRWRGGVVDAYDSGVWATAEFRNLSDMPRRPPLPPPFLLRPGQERLDFTVAAHAGGLFLAEPVRIGGDPAHQTTAATPDPPRPGPLRVVTRGPVLPRFYSGPREYHYRQTADPNDDPDRTPADADPVPYTESLKRQDVPGLTAWTSALLTRLAVDPVYGLTPSDIPSADNSPAAVPQLPLASRERVGRALTAYLARSGEYGYTLDLRRQDLVVDPVMDFLVNVKQGHCERFASALALMLRSQGVPSRLVVGFRGCGDLADDVYVVRQNQAHAWVEMLAPARSGPGLEWVTLDPTPAAEAGAAPAYSLWEWWQDGARTSQQLWGGLVVNYNAEQQAGLWESLKSPRAVAALTAAAVGLPLLAVAGVLTWASLCWRRRTRGAAVQAAAPGAVGYARLVGLLARHGRPRPLSAQTPREFAAEARRFLLSLPGAAAFADLPDEVVDRLYRVRFGGQTLTAEDVASVGARLDDLTAALRAGGRPPAHDGSPRVSP